MRKTSPDATNHRWSEATAFPLVEQFKEIKPTGTDKELAIFMGAPGKHEMARKWRVRYEQAHPALAMNQ